MGPFEQHLRKIDNLISIKDEDRKPYTEMYDEVRTWLVREMRRVSPAFNKLFAGTCLFGSYTNGVRVILPKEFDVLITLKFPFKIPLSRDKNRSGFVWLNIKSVLKKLAKDPNYTLICAELIHLFDAKYGFLRRDKFQMWIHDVIQKVIDNQPASRYEISFQTHAVAQNIYVRDKSDSTRKISIDFVPAISVNGSNFIRLRSMPSAAKYYDHLYAVPKAGEKIPESTQYYTFMIVNVLCERNLLWDKQNLKIVYRLLKSMRDRYKMHRLKSAFLTHLFLWAVDEFPDEFWKKPVTKLFLSMLKQLRGHFKNGNISYYWVRRVNLLGILKPDEISTYYNILNQVYTTLMSIKVKRGLTLEEVAKHFDVPANGGKSY